MRTVQVHRLFVSLALGLSLGGLASCESAPTRSSDVATTRLGKPTASGWLARADTLKPSPYHDHALFWQSPKLKGYEKFYVDAVVVVPVKTERGVLIDAATSEQLSTDLRDAVLEELGPAVTIVHEPGPGVATIRGAITRVARSRSAADRGGAQVGGAAMEVEIVDSVTRERLAAAVESDVVDDPDVLPSRVASGDAAGIDPWYDAKVVFGHWAARLRMWLVRARTE